jgi:hypothetical protein
MKPVESDKEAIRPTEGTNEDRLPGVSLNFIGCNVFSCILLDREAHWRSRGRRAAAQEAEEATSAPRRSGMAQVDEVASYEEEEQSNLCFFFMYVLMN